MALWLALSPVNADAQVRACAPRDEMLAGLERNYGETPRSLGLAANGRLVTVTVAEDEGWTIIMTYPNGLACVLAAGKHWTELPPKPDGKES